MKPILPRPKGLRLIVLIFSSLSSSFVHSQSAWSGRIKMKAITAIACLITLFLGQPAYSQNLTIPVGIGVTNPLANVEIAENWNASLRVGVHTNMANTNVQVLNSLAALGQDANDVSMVGAVAWNFFNNNNSPSWSGTSLHHWGTNLTGTQFGVPAANQGSLSFDNVSNAVISTNGETNLFISLAGNVSTTFLWDGRVGIGTQNPGSFKLAVEGSLGARKVVVTQASPFPDYVFQPGYALSSLTNVEDYIRMHGRLPGLPSADSVAINGLDLGNVQTKSVEKIEELTLYIIKQNKQIDSLQQTIRTQEERISRLEKMMQR